MNASDVGLEPPPTTVDCTIQPGAGSAYSGEFLDAFVNRDRKYSLDLNNTVT